MDVEFINFDVTVLLVDFNIACIKHVNGDLTISSFGDNVRLINECQINMLE